jgi:hypothetical protein
MLMPTISKQQALAALTTATHTRTGGDKAREATDAQAR